jgi:hypothetical protein
MRRRLYFVLPNKASADTIERELLLAHIDDHHIHFLATVDLEGLPNASLLQRSDLLHGMALGVLFGALTGAAGGLLLYFYPNVDNQLGTGVILVLAVIGALFGSWAASLIAVSVPNSRLRAFDKDINAGHILLMVDVPKERVDEITALIKSHHPEAEIRGVDTRIPAFP